MSVNLGPELQVDNSCQREKWICDICLCMCVCEFWFIGTKCSAEKSVKKMPTLLVMDDGWKVRNLCGGIFFHNIARFIAVLIADCCLC